MDEALRAVRYGMEIGYWVVIHNADLADDWSREFIDTLQVCNITDSFFVQWTHRIYGTNAALVPLRQLHISLAAMRHGS